MSQNSSSTFSSAKRLHDSTNNVEINKTCSGNICPIVCTNKYDLMYDFVNIFPCAFNCKKKKKMKHTVFSYLIQ